MGKFQSRTPWREKLEKPPKDLPKIVEVPPKLEKRFGGRRVLVPTPLLVDRLIRKVPKRNLITIKQIRERLAKDFKADSTCPLTTGIFLRIVAEAAEEDKKFGKKRITPYWRVIKADGSLNEKFPGGVKAQAARLMDEGHTIEKGKKLQVKSFEKRLVKF
jgi:hypothetical protein